MKKLLAQGLTLPSTGGEVTIDGPLTNPDNLVSGPAFGDMTLGGILSSGITFIYAFAGIALLLMLINGGFKLLTSAGTPKGAETGKEQITYAIVGFLIIFLSIWIVQFFGIIFGITEIQNIFG